MQVIFRTALEAVASGVPAVFDDVGPFVQKEIVANRIDGHWIQRSEQAGGPVLVEQVPLLGV
jgi:hypothetical protein